MFKVIVPHSKDCVMNLPQNKKNNPVPWSEVLDEKQHDWRTKDGKISRHGHYIWLRFRCNDPSCPGIIAVRGEDVLAKAPTGYS